VKLYRNKKRVKDKEYEHFYMRLTHREAYQLRKLGEEFNIDDVDEKSGQVWLKVKSNTTATFVHEDPVCSFRVRDGVEWGRFKELCRSRGLTVCGVVSDFVRACGFVPDLVESPGGVKVVNVFLGKPRSRFERKLWEERVKL